MRFPPASDSAPNVSAAAASASASGNSRRRVRNTSASVAAITSSAAPSSTRIEFCTASASPSLTTGTPVTRYLAPRRGRNCGCWVAVSNRSIARRRSASVRFGFSRIVIIAASGEGNR